MKATRSNIWLWLAMCLLVVLVLPDISFAQGTGTSAAYLGTEAAKALDEARVDSAWGWIAAVIFIVVVVFAIWMRSMKLGILAVCIVIGASFLYNGGTVATKVIPTTGQRIIQ